MFGWMVSRMLPIVPKGVVRQVAKRYVAGEDLETALGVVRTLNEHAREATIDILGEDAKDGDHADATVRGYGQVLEAIAVRGLRSNVSVKLTHLGLRLDRAGCEARLAAIIETAKGRGNFVRIDMEDSALTDVTLEIHGAMRERFGGAQVGTVLQAYLRRTVADARKLAAAGANLRLCKGIYREPVELAFHGREEIRENYLATAETLLAGTGTHVGFATHDRKLIARLRELVAKLGVPKDRFEFQALLGVPIDDLLDELAADGHKVRIYVPYGEEWYPYSSRRLKENPKLATYIVRQMFHLGAG